MKNIGNVVPSVNENSQEKKPELKSVPIFRNNDLYAELFPEVKSTLEKGEDEYDNVQKIVQAIIKNKNKAVILDDTCLMALYASFEAFPEKLNLREVFKNNDDFDLDMNTFKDLLKTNYNIEIEEKTIDSILSKKMGFSFSPELIKSLLRIAKEKNPKIQRIFILTPNIADHTSKEILDTLSEYSDLGKEIGKNIIFTDGWDTEESKKKISLVLAVLKDIIKQEFNLEPSLVSTIDPKDIIEGDLVIVDRHNSVISEEEINEKFPKQVSLLPIESELLNNEKFLGDKFINKELIKNLREDFEKKEE